MIRLLILLAFFTGCAATPKHPIGGYGAPLLWQLSDEDTTIYLFGSIHALPEGLDWRTDAFNTAFEQADTFCIETDADGKADEYRDYIRQFGFFENGERLTDYLSDEEAEDVFEVAEAVRVDTDYIDRMKPWNAMFDLSQRVNELLGLDLNHGVEFSLLPEARASGKEICEMESPFETVTSISSLPLNVQLTVLTHEREAFRDLDDLDRVFEKIREYNDEMLDEWLRGDIGAMEEDDILDSYGHMDFYNAILTRRNQNWVPRIEALLDEPGVKLVTVGAAHLFGPDSVVTMLRNKGYEVDGP